MISILCYEKSFSFHKIFGAIVIICIQKILNPPDGNRKKLFNKKNKKNITKL